MKKIQLIALMTLMMTSLSVLAAAHLPFHTVVKSKSSPAARQTQQDINALFNWIIKIGKRKIPLNKQGMQKYIDENIQYIVNAKTVAANRTQLFSHWRALMSRMKFIYILKPVKEMVLSGNQAGAAYDLYVQTAQGRPYQDNVIVIMRFKDHKLLYWQEVYAQQK